MDDFKKALSEIKRVLKDDGILVILEPSKKTNKWADPRLTRGDSMFNNKLYKTNILSLRKAKDFLEKQKSFDVIHKEIKELNIWILRK